MIRSPYWQATRPAQASDSRQLQLMNSMLLLQLMNYQAGSSLRFPPASRLRCADIAPLLRTGPCNTFATPCNTFATPCNTFATPRPLQHLCNPTASYRAAVPIGTGCRGACPEITSAPVPICIGCHFDLSARTHLHRMPFCKRRRYVPLPRGGCQQSGGMARG